VLEAALSGRPLTVATLVLPAPVRPTMRARSSRVWRRGRPPAAPRRDGGRGRERAGRGRNRGGAGGGRRARRRRGGEARLVAQVVGRGVAGHAAGVLADDHGLVAVKGHPGGRPAVALVEGGALDVGLGECRAGRGHAIDERRGALGRRRAGEGRQLAVAGLALDVRRLGVPLAVLAQGLAEAGGELGAAEAAVDFGDRDAAPARRSPPSRRRARPARGGSRARPGGRPACRCPRRARRGRREGARRPRAARFGLAADGLEASGAVLLEDSAVGVAGPIGLSWSGSPSRMTLASWAAAWSRTPAWASRRW